MCTVLFSKTGINFNLTIIRDEIQNMSKLAVMLDVSRSRVLNKKTFKNHLNNIKMLGYNQVFLNIEHVFKLDKYPKIGLDCDSMSPAEWKELDEYATLLNLELIPVIQSFGHMFHILKWPDYRHLSESEDLWSVNFSKEVYDFFEYYYKQVATSFKSNWIHIGGDEVYDLGKGKSKPLVDAGARKEDLFIEHIKKLQKIAQNHHKKVMIWGDMLEKSLKILDLAEKGMGLCYWNYDFRAFPENYLKALEKVELLYFCSGTNTWKSSFPRVNYACNNFKYMNWLKNNIPENFKEKVRHMVTDWGDGGHIHGYKTTELMFSLANIVFSKTCTNKFTFNRNYTSEILHKALENLQIKSSEQASKVIFLLDKIHRGDLFNANIKIIWNRSRFATRYLFFDSALNGLGFRIQQKENFSKFEHELSELRKFKTYLKKESCYCDLLSELNLSLEFTEVIEAKFKLHLSYREKNTKRDIEEIIFDYIRKMRSYLSNYFAYWQKTSMVQGEFYLRYFFTKTLNQELENYNYFQKNTETCSELPDFLLADDPENISLFSVGNCMGLKALWENQKI